MITIENRQVYSSTGLHIHRKGSDVYFHRCTMLPNETEADFEEVENVPTEELAEAITAKIAEIDAYDTSSAVNEFYLNGTPCWLDRDTRVSLMNSTTITKAAGEPNTTLWLNGKALTIPCDTAIVLLGQLEMYALKCYNKTAEHKANVQALTSIEDVQAYDITKGYPEKLQLTF